MKPNLFTQGGGMTTEGLRAIEGWLANALIMRQTSLVGDLFRAGDMGQEIGFSWDDVINLAAPNEDDPETDDIQEIYEYWLVNPWLAGKLIEAGQPVLKNEYGIWWGRTCTGQYVYCDDVIYRLAAQYGVVDITRE